MNSAIKNLQLVSKLKAAIANASGGDKLGHDISERKTSPEYKPEAQNSSCHIKVDPADLVTLGSGIFNPKSMAEADKWRDADK